MAKEKTAVANSRNSGKIVAAARELIKEKGYLEVSVRDICQRADVSRSSFYSVFSGKDAVVVQMIRSLKDDVGDVLNHIIAAENDLERIWCLYDNYITVALEFGPDVMGSLLFVDMQSGIGFMEQFYLYNDWFCPLVKNCQQKGIIQNQNGHKELVDAAVNSAFGIMLEWCRKHGSFDLRKHAFTAHEAIYNVHPDYRGLWKKQKT
ncbi:MAG: TetR/AcrR family transcriptional regulator [Oscillospiraceae bacterium]|nr:TetR/AcrR family transcriptional regulator [Oscillospiraceae bacterium]